MSRRTTGEAVQVSLGTELTRWWEQPDRFDWTTGFLGQRGLIRPAQIVMAVIAASSAVVPLSEFVTPDPNGWRIAGCAGVVAFTVGMVVFWLTRWPTRRQSTVTVLLGVACIAGWSLTRTDALVAVLSCTAMAITGAYIAFFHGLRLLAVNSAAAAAITVIASIRLDRDAGAQPAIAAFWLIFFLNLTVPLAIWGSTRAMGLYATRAQRDPLTGLLNRRGFLDTVTARLAASDPGGMRTTVHLIDLDDFKRINDTHGHPAGDRVLQSVADLLCEHAPIDATVSRTGGEEFLIAAPSPPTADTDGVGPRICAAIAALPHALTASIGSADGVFDGVLSADEFLERLILAADDAMYVAKRNGGNRTQRA